MNLQYEVRIAISLKINFEAKISYNKQRQGLGKKGSTDMDRAQGNKSQSFTATQPLLAASIAPAFVVTTPIFMLSMRSIEDEGKPWLIGGYCLLILIMAIFNFVFVNKKHRITVELDSLQIGRHEYPHTEMKKLELRKSSRYLNVYLKQRWGALGYHIKDQEEFNELMKQLRKWSAQHQVELSVLEHK